MIGAHGLHALSLPVFTPRPLSFWSGCHHLPKQRKRKSIVRRAGLCPPSRDQQSSLSTQFIQLCPREPQEPDPEPPCSSFRPLCPPSQPTHTEAGGLWVGLHMPLWRLKCGGPQVPPTAGEGLLGWPRGLALSLRRLGKGRGGEGVAKQPHCAHSEVKLSVVTYLTNSIVDEILQELYHSHKSLVRLRSPSQAQICPACGHRTISPSLSPQDSGR